MSSLGDMTLLHLAKVNGMFEEKEISGGCEPCLSCTMTSVNNSTDKYVGVLPFGLKINNSNYLTAGTRSLTYT